MHIRRLRLYGVKPLRRDIPKDGEPFAVAAQRRLLLQGANGSGKSTILETIAALWSFFGDWIDSGPAGKPPASHRGHYLADASLAAMEIEGLLPEGRPLWIGMGRVDEWVDLKDANPHAEFAGLIHVSGKGWEIQLPTTDFGTIRQRSLVGSEPFPNVCYFPPESRVVIHPDRVKPQLVDLMPFNWVARYARNVDLNSLLLTVRAKTPETYDEALAMVNKAINNQRKEITGLTPEGLLVEGRTPFGRDFRHPIHELSSGEKQMLLLIGFVTATLREGGIVLIDEPDLHIHITMIPQLLESIETIVHRRHGQLIVAAHTEPVWKWFSRDAERVELAPWREV
jgi:energy-coupling factor transporter ATP-binding protein EcfA2